MFLLYALVTLAVTLHHEPWRDEAEVTPVSRVAARSAQHFGNREWLFLSNAPLAQPQQYGLTLVYATQEPLMQGTNAPRSVNDERYWLYRTDDGRR